MVQHVSQMELTVSMAKLVALTLAALLALCVGAQAQVCQFSSLPFSGQLLPKQNSSAGTTGAVSASIPAPTNGQTAYLCGFVASSNSTTTAVQQDIAITGTQSAMHFSYLCPSTGQGALGVSFSPTCIPASTTNTAIQVGPITCGAGTAGVSITVWGCHQ